MNIRGWVLAGGASSRMGEEKSALLFGEESLLSIAIEKSRAICGNATVLCGNDPQRARNMADTLCDQRPSCGPLGGIETALRQTDTDCNLFLAVDTPLIPLQVLRVWAEEVLLHAGVGAAMMSDRGRLHPLPLILRRELLPSITSSLNAAKHTLRIEIEGAVKNRGMSMVSVDVDSLILSGLSNQQRDGRAVWFANGNTPSEIESMRRFAYTLKDS